MTADRLLDMALARPAQFSPGSAMKYTNTNYVIAGLLIEAVTAFNASAAGMSGELISTNEDTAAFITALLDGRVVPPAQLSQMMDTVEQSDEGAGFRYGLGLASIDLPCGVTVWGHGGDIEGYHSLMVKPVDEKAVSVTFTQSPDSESILDDPRAAVLDAAYCTTA
jgi:D-alanyl-D-alanine carboxypeptidase